MWGTDGTTNEVYPRIIEGVVVGGDQVGIDRDGALDNVTYELHPAEYTIDTPDEHLVTSYGRPVNVAFALAEVIWILSGRADVEMLRAYNSTIEQFSDDGIRFNAAYGDRLRKSFGVDQLQDIILTLKDDPSSRQATMVISNPVDDKGWNRMVADDSAKMVYVKHKTKDRACNLVSHAMIRNDRLDWLQILRSNDAIWGVPYNIMQWTHVQQWVAASVGVEMGKFTAIADSMHIYAKHLDGAKQIRWFDLYTYCPAHEPMVVGDEVINILQREEMIIRTAKTAWEPPGGVIEAIGDYWTSVLKVLWAHRLYTEGEDEECARFLRETDQVYGYAQARFYYQHRWHKQGFENIMKSMLMEPEVYEWATTRLEEE